MSNKKTKEQIEQEVKEYIEKTIFWEENGFKGNEIDAKKWAFAKRIADIAETLHEYDDAFCKIDSIKIVEADENRPHSRTEVRFADDMISISNPVLKSKLLEMADFADVVSVDHDPETANAILIFATHHVWFESEETK